MKNLMIICILILSVSIVNAQEKKSRKQIKAEKEAKLIEQTHILIDQGMWEFDATRMLPARGKSKILTSDYSVIYAKNKVDSYLPYFGRAYSVDYGSTDSPLTFKSPVKDYTVKPGKKGGYIIKFSAKNKSDKIDFILNISSNGSASLSVNSTNRETISFSGEIKPYDDCSNE